MISQKQANQLRIVLLRKQSVISLQELRLKGPKVIMDQIHYSVSEDEYENQDEITNIRYAQLTEMDKPTLRSNHFLSIQHAKKKQQEENSTLFYQRQGSKPRSNTPRRRSNFADKPYSEQKFDEQSQEVIDSQDNKRKKTIKKSQTQDEQTLSLLQESTPKYEKGSQNLNNLRNIVHFYIEDTENEQYNLKQGNLNNYKIRQLSHDEFTCQFEYLTNLRFSFKRASQYKKEVIKMIYTYLRLLQSQKKEK